MGVPVREQGARRERTLTYAASALLPVCLTLVSLALAGRWPFGDATAFLDDMLVQYADFYAWFRRVLLGQDSLMYSTALSLGQSTWPLYSYYLASPLNLLVLLTDGVHLAGFVLVTWCIRLALLGCSTTAYLRGRFGLRGPACCALSLAFTCGAWVTANLRNPMWIDAVVMLPLVLLALWRFLRTGRRGALVSALAVAAVLNWYVAYMVYLFAALWWLFERAICKSDGTSLHEPHLGREFLHLAPAVLASLGLAAWTLIPTALGIAAAAQASSVSGSVFQRGLAVIASPKGTALVLAGFAGCALLLALSLLVARKRGQRVTTVLACAGIVALLGGTLACGLIPASSGLAKLRTATPTELALPLVSAWKAGAGAPQTHVGLPALAGAMALLALRRVTPGVKLAYGFVLSLLVASVCLRPLYFVWCGFAAPHGYFSRISYLLSFALVWGCGYALRARERGAATVTDRAGAANAAASCTGAMATATMERTGTAEHAGPAQAPTARPMWPQGAVAAAALALTAAQLLVVGTLVWSQGIDTAVTQQQNDAYLTEAATQLSSLEATDPSAWRLEKTYDRNTGPGHPAVDESLALGFSRISSYSSTTAAGSLTLLHALGYGFPNEAYLRYQSPMLPADALLGVRYVASTWQPAGMTETDEPATSVGARVWENPWALPVGYGVADGAAGATLSPDTDPFQAQNQLASALVGRGVTLFRPIAATAVESTPGRQTWQVTVPAGTIAYVYPLPQPGSLSSSDPTWLTIDAGAPLAENLIFNHAAWALADGTASADASHTVSLSMSADPNADPATLPAIPSGTTCVFYALDANALQQVTDELASQPLELTEFGGSHVSGTVTTDAASSVLLTIPNEPGWTVEVNGEREEPVGAFGDGLMVIPVTPGTTNTIEMRFMTPGLLVGCLVTVTTVANIAVVALLRRRAR